MTPRWTLASARIVLVVVTVLGAVLTAPGTGHGSQSAHAAGGARPAGCRPAEQAFRPAWVRMPDVVGKTRVLALGRDRNGVPRTPPLTNRGKWQLAWDRESGIRPGEKHGVIRLNAHTYPWSGIYGSALGNRLLSRLQVGDRIVALGRDGSRICYDVSRRVRTRAERPLRAYYSSTGPSRLAILVCSGRRRGPGDWSHRTVWFAKPVRTGTADNLLSFHDSAAADSGRDGYSK